MISETRLNELLVEEITRAKSVGIDLKPINRKVKVANLRSSYGCNQWSKGHKDVINISKYYLDAPEEEIRTVICHEVCHSVRDSKGHDAKWRYAIRKMRDAYEYLNADYHLCEHPYGNNGRKDLPHTDLAYRPREAADPATATHKAYKYKLTCGGCGKEFFYTRMCKVIKLAKSSTPRIFCRNCGCAWFTVDNL